MSRNARLLQRSENEIHAGLQEAAKRNALGKPQASRLVSFFASSKERPEGSKLGSMKESTNTQLGDSLKSRLRDATDFKVPLGNANRTQDGGKLIAASSVKPLAEASKQADKLVKQTEMLKLADRSNAKVVAKGGKVVAKPMAKTNLTNKQSENVVQKLLSGDIKSHGAGMLTRKPVVETRARAAARRLEQRDEPAEHMDVSNLPDSELSDSGRSGNEVVGVEQPIRVEHTDVALAVRELRAEIDAQLIQAAQQSLASASRLARSRAVPVEEEQDGDDEQESEDLGNAIENEPPKKAAVQASRVQSETPNLVNDPQLRNTLTKFESGDPQLLAEYVVDHFSHLRFMEATKMAVRRGYMMTHWEVKPRYRELAFDWLVCVAQRFNLLPETYYLATHLFDRFMQQSPVPRVQIQLVAIASLYVASKLEETYLPDVSDFLFVTDDAISRAELFEAERKLLDTLQFAVNAPNPLVFLRRYSRIFQYALMLARREEEDDEPTAQQETGYTPGWFEVAQRIDVRRVHQLSKYVLETSTYDYELAHVGASQRAAAALLLAMRAVSWPRTPLAADRLDAHVGMRDDLVFELSDRDLLACNTAGRVANHVTDRLGRQRTQLVRLPSMWTAALACHSEHNEDELLPIVRRLITTITRTRRDAKLQSTKTKYSDPQFDGIAHGVELDIVLQRGEQLLVAAKTQ